MDQWALCRWMGYRGIPIGYQRMSLWDWDLSGRSEVAEVCLKYIQDLIINLSCGIGMCLLGKMGTGKSLTAAMIAKEALCHRTDTRYTTYYSLINAYASGWGYGKESKEAKEHYESEYKNKQLLIIDEIGREGRKNSKEETSYVSRDLLNDVLDHRTQNNLPTILTSNLSMDQMREIYDPRIASLASSSMVTHTFIGSDYRAVLKQRYEQEQAHGLVRPIVLISSSSL